MPGDSDKRSLRNPTPSVRTAEWLFLAVSVCLFLASLTQDGFYLAGENPRAWAPCIGLLLVGWIAVFAGVFAWLANPALFVAWILLCFRSTRYASLVMATISAAFALSFLAHQEILANENGGTSKITGYGLGYWLWLASIFAAIVGSLVAVIRAVTNPADSDLEDNSSCAPDSQRAATSLNRPLGTGVSASRGTGIDIAWAKIAAIDVGETSSSVLLAVTVGPKTNSGTCES